MQTPRDAIRSTFRVIEGGKPAAPPAPAPMIGFMHTFDHQTYEPGGYGKVEITPRPDGSYLVRAVRSGVNCWQDA